MKLIWKPWSGFKRHAWVGGLLLAAIPVGSARAQSQTHLATLTADAGPAEVGEGLVGASSSGEIRGTTRDGSGLLTVGKVRIVIHSAAEKVDRTVMSDDHGIFVVSDVKPGRYEIAAEKRGFSDSPIATIELTALQHVELNLFLGVGRLKRQAQVRNLGLSRREAAAQPVAAATLNETAPLPSTPTTNPRTAANAGSNNSELSAPAIVAADPKALAITEELDALKKRIDELESQLKDDKTADPLELAASPATPATAQESTTLTAKADVPSQPQDTAQGTAGKAPKPDPFSYADWTWMNANGRAKDSPLDSKYFTGEFRADTNYMFDLNHPKDDTIGGSTESFRSNEFQVEQLSLGGNLHVGNARGRILTMFGMFATTTPRNDASAARGQWDLADAYRYVSEAWGGYHFNVNYGLNVDAGIFVSYIGLFSYYNYDNWTYQPSFVSSNTPWFFNGLRIQWFPTEKLKIEPWLINGWQSYGRFGSKPGAGGQVMWRPKPWLAFVFNNYGLGTDSLGNGQGTITRSRFHTDDSVEVRYYNRPESKLDMMAFSATGDLGCETGGVLGANVSCFGTKTAPQQAFLGWMIYNRMQFFHDKIGLTLGGGQMGNPGRYLTLLPPINGANAISGSPYFTANPGDKFKGGDGTITIDYMPSQYMTFRGEYGYRTSSVPYWSGRGGITPPGGNTGAPGSYVCTNGTFSATSSFTPSGSGFAVDNAGNAVGNSCTAQLGAGWTAWQPDLRKSQSVFTLAVLVKF